MELGDKALKIVNRLAGAGFTALYAGGSVRDLLLGKPAKDIDIATNATPVEVQSLFERTVPVGAHFGVVIVLQDGTPFEVATFRADGEYLDGRRPEGVVFTDARGDALRRDFTINGLFLDPGTGDVIDHVGGRQDLENGVLRAIGNAAERFQEDYLRVLRGVRFAAALDLKIDPDTWQGLQSAVSGIGAVSAERIREELVKIFTASTRVRGLDLLDESGLLAILLPEVVALKGCEQPPEFHPEGDVFVHTRIMLGMLGPDVSPALAFGVLLHDIGKPRCFFRDETGRIRFNGHEHVGANMAEAILRRLKFSNHEIFAAVEMVRNHMAFKDAPNMRTAKLRRFIARETFIEELELHRVDCGSSHGSLDIYDFLKTRREEFANEPIIPPRLLTGADLIALGWKPGPQFRETLETAHNLQMEGTLSTREEALAWARKSGWRHPGVASNTKET